MNLDTFLLTIGKNEILNKENFTISSVSHCVDQKDRPVSICNIKYLDNDDEKYLLLELPFLKVIKKEDNFIYLLIEDNIKRELNDIDDILLNLIDDIENRDDCKDTFENITTDEFIYNTVLKTNEQYSYIKIFYNKSSNFLYKEKETNILNIDINDMVQVILLIESIRIYTNDSCCLVKNVGQNFIIHKPVKQYEEPKINLTNLNTHYKEDEFFKKQVIDDISKTIMEEENIISNINIMEKINEDDKNLEDDKVVENITNIEKQIIKKRGRKPTKK